ncbi:MAG: isoprenyl transferase [Tissierellia bacterium]|nr:isoprenyl transferase [Tissierellia bacterium]
MNMNELQNRIDINRLPLHVGIIMDGNGRWATRRGLPRPLGHREGMLRVVDIVRCASDLGIKHLTLYAFSTENWKRPKEEVEGLMSLLLVYISKRLEEIYKNNVKINVFGNMNDFSDNVQNALTRAMERTQENDGMVLNLALNYGGQQEIVRACKKIVEQGISADEISSKVFKDNLYSQGQPDLDLIMRPSGEQRLSNFMLFQAAYSEFYFTDVLWPDFTEDEFYKAIIEYQGRSRRFGGV